MMGPLTTSSLRSTVAAGALLALFGTTPARAATITVFWDRADFGFGEGWGLSQDTANAAQAAGIDILPAVANPDVTEIGIPVPKPDSLAVEHNLNEATLVLPQNGPATIRSNWGAINDTGITNQNLYLVYVRPVTNTITLDGQQHDVTYDPADVGLRLTSGESGLDWVILQVPSNPVDPNSIPVYYPAVSLGILGIGEPANYPLFYTLHNPQVFEGDATDELGLPKWTLAFTTAAPIPEPSSGLLMSIGLLGIAQARRKHA